MIEIDPKLQKDATEAAEAFRIVFKKMEEDLPRAAVLTGMAACLAERGIVLRPEGMGLDEAAQRTADLVLFYGVQVVVISEDEEAA